LVADNCKSPASSRHHSANRKHSGKAEPRGNLNKNNVHTGQQVNTLSDIRYVLTIAVVVLSLNAQLSLRAGMIVNFPGVFLHELMHYIVALVLNGKPTRFSVFPQQIQDGGWAAGYVLFSNVRWYNAMPMGLAPLLILLAAWNLHRVLYGGGWWSDFPIVQNILYVVFEVFLIRHAIPSVADVKVVFTKPLGLVAYAIIAALSTMVFEW